MRGAPRFSTGSLYKQYVCLCSKYKRNIQKCLGIRILKSLNIVNLHGVMTMLKLKINVNLPQLLCIVVWRVVTATQNPPNRSKLAILSRRNDNTQQLNFNIVITRCKFTILTLQYPHAFLYISNINRHTACMGSLSLWLLRYVFVRLFFAPLPNWLSARKRVASNSTCIQNFFSDFGITFSLTFLLGTCSSFSNLFKRSYLR